jgi:cell division protein ZapA
MHVRQAQRFDMNVAGVDVSFGSKATPEIIGRARDFIEAKYEELKSIGRQAGKDQLLVILAMGIANEMLQSRQELEETHARLDRLLSCIERTEQT